MLNSKWRSESLSELTPIILNMELTHLVSEASTCLSFYQPSKFYSGNLHAI